MPAVEEPVDVNELEEDAPCIDVLKEEEREQTMNKVLSEDESLYVRISLV
jgi:hypothetical protein